MQIPISIEVDGSNTAVCGQNCPFRCSDGCILFNDDLEKVPLKEGWEYQTGSDIPTLRCWKCCSIVKEDLCENDKE